MVRWCEHFILILCEEEFVYFLDGTGAARIGRGIVQGEAENFSGYLAGGEAHHHLNTGLSNMICIIIGQRLGFDFADYLDQNKRMYPYAGRSADFFNVAAVSHPRSIDYHAFTALNAEGLRMHLPGKTFIQT